MKAVFPTLVENTEVNWFDLAGWILRENRLGLMYQEPGRIRPGLIRGLLEQALNYCEELNVAVAMTWDSDTYDGLFYVLANDSESASEERDYKLGFSKDVEKRLTTFRTILPNVACMHCWPTMKAWEEAARDCVVRTVDGTTRLGTSEVVRSNDLGGLIVRLNQFFELMGSIKPSVVDDLHPSFGARISSGALIGAVTQ